MLILSLDTTMDAMSVAIYDHQKSSVIAHDYRVIGRGHAEALPAMIESLCQQVQVKLADFDRFCATCGPGSFTGVRVGLAMVRGLSLALSIPAIGITSLELIAANTRKKRGAVPVLVIHDAKRDEVYLQGFDANGQENFPATLSATADLANIPIGSDVVITGSGRHLWPHDAQTDDTNLPDAYDAGMLAAACPLPDQPPIPLYLRQADAKPQAKLIVRQDDGM